MKQIKFTKYDAAGNTFLVVEPNSTRIDRRLFWNISQRLCDASAGVGADGLLTIRPSRRADFALDVFNADGSWAGRSGNGLRAAVAHVSRTRPRKTDWTIACGQERVEAKIISRSAKGLVVRTQVGIPEFSNLTYTGVALKLSQLPKLKGAGKSYRYLRILIGNPHVVIIVRRIPQNWVEIGRVISRMDRFRIGANIEFACSKGPAKIEVRSYERGVGPTASSGTGAAAALVALRVLGRVNKRVVVDFGMQNLSAAWIGPGQMVTVTGPVQLRFSGVAPL